MTNISYEEAERRFQKIKQNTVQKDWVDHEFIVAKAKALPPEDAWLAFRLLQRAHNLAPENEEVMSLVKQYKMQAQKGNDRKLNSIRQSLVDKLNEVSKGKISTNEIGNTMAASIKKGAFKFFVVIPFLIFFIYCQFIETEMYESRSRLVIKQPDSVSTLSPEMALLGSLGATSEANDASVLRAYISSTDMLKSLQRQFDLRAMYVSEDIDFVSRLAVDASSEEFLEHYLKHVQVEIEQDTGIINVYVRSNESEFAYQLSKTVLEKSENYINQIGHELAEAQLEFVRSEHELSVQRLQQAQQSLLTFQSAHGLLDPESEGVAMQSITFGLESKIAEKKAELSALRQFMADNSAEIIRGENALLGLQQQLDEERQRLSENEQNTSGLSISQVLVKFSELKVDVEMALQSYSASLVSLEKSRVEAYRQLKYLVTVESPTKPDATSYPDVPYKVTLFTVILLLVYGVLRIVIATILELK